MQAMIIGCYRAHGGASRDYAPVVQLEERHMKKIRTALGAILFTALIAGAQGCAEIPTAPTDDDSEPVCYWINGTLHCAE